jgi:hypothetical protein
LRFWFSERAAIGRVVERRAASPHDGTDKGQYA